MDSCGKTMLFGLVLFIAVEFGVLQRLPPIQPIAFRLPAPPRLIGPLAPNEALTGAEKVHQNLIKGPSFFVNHNGSLYVGTVDNEIYDMASCPPQLVVNVSPTGCKSMHTCGQLTSLRLDPVTDELLVLVNFIGLLQVNPQTGTTSQLYSARQPVNGRQPVYLTDLVALPDGTVIMADASDAYAYPNDIYICQDSRPRGRLLAFTRTNGQTRELLPNSFFHPISLELSTDNSDLLVSEACRARIRKVSLQRPTLLAVTDFSVNLPGLPANIRATNHGTYWLALRFSRHSLLRRNPYDLYSTQPMMRTMATRYMNRQQLENTMSSWSTILELNQTGSVIGSMHDPHGSTFRRLTEVQEMDGVLYIGSDLTPYAGRMILPETADRKIKIDSFIQILRSRCRLPDKDVESMKAQLLEKYPHLA